MLTKSSASRWAVWLSTGFGAGYLPKMPGTYGSLQGVALYLGLHFFLRETARPVLWLSLAVLGLVLLSWWVIAKALPSFSVTDPQSIVLDEVAGQSVTLLATAFFPTGPTLDWTHLLAGFILFRALDIWKPYSIRRLERLSGATGVLGDDVGAGIVGGLILAGLGHFG
jgi:phosphatidylglycerophosphatase A